MPSKNGFTKELFNPLSLMVFAALGAMSFIAVTVAVFKTMQFARMGVGPRKRAEEMLDTWLSGRSDDALQMAADRNSLLARILQAVFSGMRARPGEPAYAEELGRQTAITELASMSDRMRLLEIVVQAAQILGLLGTVIGMIDAFSVLSLSQGAVNPAALAGGIWTALTTTAVRLSVALATYFTANLFEARIYRERNMPSIRRLLPVRTRHMQTDTSLAIVNIVLLMFVFLATGSLMNSPSFGIAPSETAELPIDQLPHPILIIGPNDMLSLNDKPVAPDLLATAVQDLTVLHVR